MIKAFVTQPSVRSVGVSMIKAFVTQPSVSSVGVSMIKAFVTQPSVGWGINDKGICYTTFSRVGYQCYLLHNPQ